MSDIFSPSSLAKHVHATLDDALTAIPDGDSKALLIRGTYDPEHGPTVVALWVQRAPAGWNVLLEGAYGGDDGPSAGVAIARSWK